MHAFERAQNVIVQHCSFIDNNSGRTETSKEGKGRFKIRGYCSQYIYLLHGRLLVLFRLENASASGVSYDTIDHQVSNSFGAPDLDQASITTLFDDNQDRLINFVHGISPSDVQAYGERVVKYYKEKPVLLVNIFLERFISQYTGQGRRRLVTTFAYQLVVSPHAPKELQIEILHAFFQEPDIPQHNLENQFQKLIVLPLQKFQSVLPPVVFVLDSVHNIPCGSIGDIIGELAQALNRLHLEGVDAKAAITGMRYHGIITALQGNIQTITRTYPTAVTNPSPFRTIIRAFSFPFLDWMYSRSLAVQFGVLTACLTIFILGSLFVWFVKIGPTALEQVLIGDNVPFLLLVTCIYLLTPLIFIFFGTCWLLQEFRRIMWPVRFDSP